MLSLEAEQFEQQPWSEAFKRVLSEKDPSKVLFRIEVAKTAVEMRIAELAELPNLTGWRKEIDSINLALDLMSELAAQHTEPPKPMVL